MTVHDILNQIEYTVIIDGVEKPGSCITFSTWMENMIKQSENVSGYTPAEMFDPVARDNFQKYFAVAYYAGLIPAKVIETRTNEIGEDGCYIFTVETVGSIDPEADSIDKKEEEKNMNTKTETETRQQKTDRENREHCKYIADMLEAVADGRLYRCPECGEFFEWKDEQYNEEEGTYTCPECGKVYEENELEAVSMFDYFENVYDIEYRIGSDKAFRSVRLMVACGGPNIYIDTAEKAVLLYWWTDFARYNLTSDTAEAINEAFEELYEC